MPGGSGLAETALSAQVSPGLFWRHHMEYRLLGRSGLKVSTITLGTMTMGGDGQFAKVGNVGLDEARRQIDLCLDHGVNLIDTANIYSAGASETIVGQALAGKRPKGVLLATK